MPLGYSLGAGAALTGAGRGAGRLGKQRATEVPETFARDPIMDALAGLMQIVGVILAFTAAEQTMKITEGTEVTPDKAGEAAVGATSEVARRRRKRDRLESTFAAVGADSVEKFVSKAGVAGGPGACGGTAS